MRLFVVGLFIALGATTSALAGSRVLSSETMGFESCLAVIRATATELGVAPVNIVETDILRVVRFPTNDGSGESLLVTCSRPDSKMTINLSW